MGLLIAVKLTPFAIGWWLFVERRRTAVASMLAVLAIAAIVSLLGAGIGEHVRYLEVARQTSTTGAIWPAVARQLVALAERS